MFSLYLQNISTVFRKAFSVKEELLWFISGQIFNLGANFYIIKTLSNIGKREFGEYVLILTISAFLGLLIFGPAQQGLIRYFYKSSEENNLSKLINLFNKFIAASLLSIVLVGLILFTVFDFINIQFSKELILCVTFFITSSKADEFFNVSLNIIRQRKLNSILQISEKTLVIFGISVLIYLKILTLFSALLILSFIYGGFALIKFSWFDRIVKTKFIKIQKETLISTPFNTKELLLYIAPFILWGVSAWFQQNSEKWIMAKYLSIIDVGLYGILIMVVNMLIATPNALLSDFMSPIIFEKFSNLSDKKSMQSGNQFIRITNLTIICIVGFAVIATFLCGNILINLFSNSSYTALSGFLPLFAVGTGIFYIAQSMNYKGLVFNKPNVYLLPKIILSIISVSLNIILILSIGIVGVAYASIISSTVYLIHIYFINRRFII